MSRTQTVIEPSREPSDSCSPASQPSERTEKPAKEAKTDIFAEFWSAFPRKVGKIAAEKAWAKAIKREMPERIIAAVKAWPFADHMTPRGDFRPHPASWLNAGQWDDECVANAKPAKESAVPGGKSRMQLYRDAYMAWDRGGQYGAPPKLDDFPEGGS